MKSVCKSKFSIGDYIIDYENIYLIYDQKEQKNSSGQDCKYFFYKAVETTERLKSVTCSIPIDNVYKSGLRHLINRADIDKFYKILPEQLDPSLVFDIKTVKDTLYLNDPINTLVLLKQLYLDKTKSGEKFSKTNQEYLNAILNHLVSEISFVSKVPAKKVELEILTALKSSIA